MTISTTTNFTSFSSATQVVGARKAPAKNTVFSVIWRALEAHGRQRAISYFSLKSDEELRALGLSRATIAERLKAS